MRHFPFACALACMTGLSATVYAQNPTVQTMILPNAEPDRDTYAVAINSRGVVTGYLSDTSHALPPKAFTWTRTGGYRIVLDEAGAVDINDSGAVIGFRQSCGLDSGECEPRGFVWTASAGATDLGEFQPRAINNKGIIVGTCGPLGYDPDEAEGCIRTGDGAIRKLPQRFVPLDINDRGAVVGYYIRAVEDGVHRAAVWASSFGVRDLDRDPAEYAVAEAINESSIVVGYEWEPGRRATVWTPIGRAEAPQGMYSSANSISDRGWVVGRVSSGTTERPALWLLGGRLVELPTPGATSGSAFDVNDAGLIIGWIDGGSGGGTRSVLWIVK